MAWVPRGGPPVRFVPVKFSGETSIRPITRIKAARLLPSFMAALLMAAACQIGPARAASPGASGASPASRPAHAQALRDFGDPRAGRLAERFWAVEAGRSERPFAIVQFGDSHTASDAFTAGLRVGLQQRLGDAGVGWLPPMAVPGQGHQRVNLESQGWRLTSSLDQASDAFPLGGDIASPAQAGAVTRVASWAPDQSPYLATVLVRPGGRSGLFVENPDGRRLPLDGGEPVGGWSYVQVPVRLPFQIVAPAAGAAEVGGIWLRRADTSGALVSPIGVNGSRQDIWTRWSPGWLDQLRRSGSDLVIIAYGTNEAFNGQLDPQALAAGLAQGIRQVRQALPEAAVLLLGAPGALDPGKPAALPCGERGVPMHETVKRVQLDVARQEKTLYWDWEAAMDGDCPMLDWQARGWVGPDLIHFTQEGYRESSRRFYRALMNFFERSRGRR